MTDETLKLLQQAVRKRGAPITSISQQAVDLCGILDHEISLFRYDRNRLTEEIKQMRTRIERLEKRASGTDQE